MLGEDGGAVSVAKLTHRDEGTRSELGSELDSTSSSRERWQIEFAFMSGMHNAAVGASNCVRLGEFVNVDDASIVEMSIIGRTTSIEDFWKWFFGVRSVSVVRRAESLL